MTRLTADVAARLMVLPLADLRAATRVCSTLVAHLDGVAYDLCEVADDEHDTVRAWADDLEDRVRRAHGMGVR